jgi:3-oxoadipate enol-lactonase
METTSSDGARINYSVDGPAGAPAVLFSNSLGTNLTMWDPQVEALAGTFRIVRYDTRGHGASEVPQPPYVINQLAQDALAVLDSADVERAHVCGLSLGGVTAMWLAVHHPERVGRLVLANTAARIGNDDFWQARIATVETGGMAGLREQVLARFFSERFLDEQPETVERIAGGLEATDSAGYIGACLALRDADLRSEVRSIRAQTLIIAGEVDAATPPELSEQLNALMPGSRLIVIPGAGHLSNLEAPDEFSEVLTRFFQDANASA